MVNISVSPNFYETKAVQQRAINLSRRYQRKHATAPSKSKTEPTKKPDISQNFKHLPDHQKFAEILQIFTPFLYFFPTDCAQTFQKLHASLLVSRAHPLVLLYLDLRRHMLNSF